MKITRLEAFAVELPMRFGFRHARARRTSSANVVVRAELEDGRFEGWGASVPREYVGGESVDSVFSAFACGLAPALARPFEDYAGLARALASGPVLAVADEDDHLAARAAVELALVDACGRAFGLSGSALAGLAFPSIARRDADGPVRYGAVLNKAPLPIEMAQAAAMRFYGLSDFKIKVGFDVADDLRRVSALRGVLGRDADIRADANGAWMLDQLRSALEGLAAAGVTSIEEPVRPDELEGLAELAPSTPVPFMLDESLRSMADAARAADLGLASSFNIRISKCGGLVRAMAIAEFARSRGLSYQLGCQVGECGILSAAGRAFASGVDGITHLEGSYDRFLMGETLVRGDISFGRGGLAAPLAGPGLGVNVRGGRVRRIATRRTRIPIKGAGH